MCIRDRNIGAAACERCDNERANRMALRTCLLYTSYPYAPLFEAIASHRGAILSKTAYETMGADAFGRAPVGTGPMMFKEWVSGDRIELTGFEQYWGEKPAFDNMTIRFILEASSRTVELETGGVDIAFQLSPVDWSRLEENPDTKMLTGKDVYKRQA